MVPNTHFSISLLSHLFLLWNLTNNVSFVGKVIITKAKSFPYYVLSKVTLVSRLLNSGTHCVVWKAEIYLEEGAPRGDKEPSSPMAGFLSWRGQAPAASFEGGSHHPALDRLWRAPVPHQGHWGLVLSTGKEAPQLCHLQGAREDCQHDTRTNWTHSVRDS